MVGTSQSGADRREIWDLVVFHVLFAVVCVAALLAPLDLATGWRLSVCTVSYVVALPFVARRRGHPDWNELWLFLVPLSLFQVLPDWFLSAVLETLVFPDDGSPRVGTVCAYMAGLWVIPLMLVVTSARMIERGTPGGPAWRGPALAGLMALLVFGLAEATSHRLLGSWYARDVWMVGDVAIYVLPAELLLGVATFRAAARVEGAGFGAKVAAAAGVALMYTGALALSYMFVEGRAFPS